MRTLSARSACGWMAFPLRSSQAPSFTRQVVLPDRLPRDTLPWARQSMKLTMVTRPSKPSARSASAAFAAVSPYVVEQTRSSEFFRVRR